MRITPQTEKEIQEAMNFPAGTYDFEVIDAQDTVSKTSGKEMIKLTLKVFLDDGTFRQVTDYLVESMAAKVRHFFAATGQLGTYESGVFGANECHGAVGKVKIKIGKAQGIYAAKNEVADYVVPKEGEEPTQRKTVENLWGEDGEDPDGVPF